MIRLQRVGRKNDPSYRVVVTEKQNAAKSGKFLEVVGSYDARKDRRLFNAERIRHFISHGARTSPTVHNLLITEGVIGGKKINVLPKNKNRKPAIVEPNIVSEVTPEVVQEVIPEIASEVVAETSEPATIKGIN